MINNVVSVSNGSRPIGLPLTGSGVTQNGVAVEKAAAPSATSNTQQLGTKSSEQDVNIRTAVSKLNDHVQNLRRNLTFSIDEATGQTIIRVYDSETNELIREIPSEETLRIAAAIDRQHVEVLLKGQRA